jgi:hypothetical protein
MNVPPFALSDSELREVEQFARVSGLDQIARLAGELRSLRAAYQTLFKRYGMLESRTWLREKSA